MKNSRPQVKAAVSLFKAVPEDLFIERVSQGTVRWFEGFKRGFIFIDKYGKPEANIPKEVYDVVDETYGSDAVKFNNTFFEYDTVMSMSTEERIFHQISHYFSTYGREMLGLKSRSYIPHKDLKEYIADIDYSGKNIIVIKVVDSMGMSDIVDNMLKTIKAPSAAIREGYEALWDYTRCSDRDIVSFELKTIYYKKTGYVPSGNLDFLRYIMYLVTGKPMLIKDRHTILTVKYTQVSEEVRKEIVDLWKRCNIKKMAEIFYRYKPLFLAFKSFSGRELAPTINKIRRAAKTHHVPLTDASLQNVVSLLMDTRMGSKTIAINILEKSSNRDLVKVINSLANKMDDTNEKNIQVYNVRNGKTFVKVQQPMTFLDRMTANQAFNVVATILVSRLKNMYDDVVFVLPEHIKYTVPTSEKQMTHVYPWGTYVEIPAEDAFSIGVHWTNVPGEETYRSYNNGRVDLDLHMQNASGDHLGWNSGWHNEDCVYSGDITDAPLPLGAAEAFYIKSKENDYVMTLNKYCGPSEVDYKIFASKGQIDGRRFDVNTSLFPAIPMKFDGDSSEKTIGLIHDNKMFFYNGNLSRGIVPSGNYCDFIKGLKHKLGNMLTIETLLDASGATIVYEKPAETNRTVIDLSPAALDITTLLEVVDGTIVGDAQLEEIE